MFSEKNTMKIIPILKKAFQFIYFIGSLWIGIIYIVALVFWAPFYFTKISINRWYNFMKKVLDLPKELFKPKLIQPTRFAILKGNGKYLRGDWQDPFLFQLYDYTLRKFLSIRQISPNLKIAQIQCETLSQWKYFKQNGIKNVKALQSNPSFLQKQKQNNSQIQLIEQNYQISQFSNDYDCIVAFNLKEKLEKFYNKLPNENCQKINLLKIIPYIRHHLSEKGYVVYGDYFQEQGQINVLQQLFTSFGFKIDQTENIQKNIVYAEKLRTQKGKNVLQIQLLEKLILKLKNLLGLNKVYTKGSYVVFILSKKLTETK